jgi:hypothetical protein
MVEIHELLVLRDDGKTERFPVVDGNLAQARSVASRSRHPGDCLVAVIDDAFIRLAPEVPDQRPAVAQ